LKDYYDQHTKYTFLHIISFEYQHILINNRTDLSVLAILKLVLVFLVEIPVFMNTRLVWLLLNTILLMGCEAKKTRVETNPNIVFILVDDLGYMDLGYTESSFYETPNIDQLAKEGVIFTQGYATSRVCSPSRASIMTGKFTARHGITDWIGAKSGSDWRTLQRHDRLLPAEYVHQLPSRDTTLAEALQLAGYKTFFAGKWHLGEEGSYPEDHGFDINKGGWSKGSPIGGYFSPWNNPKLENQENGENLSIRLARETASFISAEKDTPFLAFLSFYAVHGPIQTDETRWSKYRNKAAKLGIAKSGFEMESVLPIRRLQDNPVYAGLVESMDEAVGIVLQSLRDNDLEENTIVVFTSDNGGVASGDAFSTSNAPLRGGKGYQWEGGIREPLVIKVPWLDNAIQKIDVSVTGADFYPTLLDLVGVDLLPGQHTDGISLKPLLEGQQIEVKRPLYWHYPHYGNQGGDPSSIILEDHWKLIYYWENDVCELYNLLEDPREQHNVAPLHPDITKEKTDKLLNWLSAIGARYPKKDTLFDRQKYQARLQTLINEKLPTLERERQLMLSEDYEPDANWWGSKVTKD
jgi:arylsulfatase A-like enzyme